jgi:sialate O-acetylesterase
MKKYAFYSLSITMLFFCSGMVEAQVSLPAVFGDNMVLQQQTLVAFWGKAPANRSVKLTASWNREDHVTHADDSGRWKIKVHTPPAGGPYDIRVVSGDTVWLHNVLAGEVWICSGQSNMEIPLQGYYNTPILHADQILAGARDSALRLFHVGRTVSPVPRPDCEGTWTVSNAASARTFSAVGFQFARMLQRRLGVPVGIIEASWGGTPIQAWMDAASLWHFPEPAVTRPAGKRGKQVDPRQPACLYNGMIAPLAGFAIRGFLWYQGERDAFHPYQYSRKMQALVQGWRAHWRDDSISFYFVQIAPFHYGPPRHDSAAFLREEQQKAADAIPHAGMVVSLDAGSAFTIHPPDKTTIARRLLYWALGDTYGEEGIAFRSPEYQSMDVEGGKVRIRFRYADRGLTSYDKPLEAFQVAGADHVFHAAKAVITGRGQVIVHSDSVANPVAVRYGFTDWVAGRLYNTWGLPAAPFRTDDW